MALVAGAVAVAAPVVATGALVVAGGAAAASMAAGVAGLAIDCSRAAAGTGSRTGCAFDVVTLGIGAKLKAAAGAAWGLDTGAAGLLFFGADDGASGPAGSNDIVCAPPTYNPQQPASSALLQSAINGSFLQP